MPIHRHMREALNPGQCRPRALQMRVAVRCAHSVGSFTFRTKSHHIIHRDTARIAASRHGAPGCEEACQDIGWNPGDKHKLRQDASCARVPLNDVIGTQIQNRNNRCARSRWNSFFFVLLYDTALESVVTAATRGCGRPRSQVCVFFIVSTQTLILYFHIRVEQVCADGSGSSTKPGL